MSAAGRSIAAPCEPLLQWSALELAAHIRAGDVSAVQVVEAYIARIETTQSVVNAIVVPAFESARQAAQAADAQRKRGEPLEPLHGVPFTIKECFHVAGLPSTLGLTHRTTLRDAEDGPHVVRLKSAGAIFLGKTNVSQLMLYHESDNPVYGRSNNPLDLQRTPGGSSGGEAAAVTAHCSAFGIGNDLGGSIRLPAAWCGICGLKPTTRRITNRGIVRNFRGLQAMRSQSGVFARKSDDLESLLSVLYSANDDDVDPVPWRKSHDVDLSQVKVWAWDDDGCFPASATAKRAVREAAHALEKLGVQVEWVRPELRELIALYYGLMMADGSRDARQLAQGSRLDPRIHRTFLLGGLPSWLRSLVTTAYAWSGRTWLVNILREARPRSAAEYWRLTYRLEELTQAFRQRYVMAEHLTAFLTPAHALPAPLHGTSMDLLPAASYAFLANLLGWPAGVLPWTNILPTETNGVETGSAVMNKLVVQTLQNAAGLPMAVQIMALPWREDVVLALMKALENVANLHR
jgi:fatty acid amide hydrolase